VKNPFRRGSHEKQPKHRVGTGHNPKDCPQDASKASRRAGKQGLTHYTCTTCGTTWSVAPPPPINPNN
jgi:hypothetical protein